MKRPSSTHRKDQVPVLVESKGANYEVKKQIKTLRSRFEENYG